MVTDRHNLKRITMSATRRERRWDDLARYCLPGIARQRLAIMLEARLGGRLLPSQFRI